MDKEFRVLKEAASDHKLTVLGKWTGDRFGVYVFDDGSHHWFASEKEAAEFLRTYDPKRHEMN